ncbi:Glycosyltransferase involved in cell wall bisynthesis [Mucilaginibacter lappiensis]|uniref:Glycosyltransferase involved in cell wall biosynthesis n=1 Tax=Mucilaginibacter lappiensis TaxID=354630 RepID=A0ABR6PMB0_9SPHI|nr:glycosyltransferase family 4 protein [Mucilaginibacter lappiensis]MBB6110912.1 glycosyltransferase involved in cell wall biosynthesis [Mucilaginibacter lappiensis]SIR60785.1 Glycosyltransferase involved in cell wall bisynthesis [Mucilaginibacter lappiensis]
MTIGLVTPYYPDKQTFNSGIANHFSILANALAQQGHRVVILYVRPSYGDGDNIGSQQINPLITLLTYPITLPAYFHKLFKNRWAVLDFLLKLRCMLVTFKILNRVIKEYQLDVIETTNYYSLCYFNFLIRKPQIPVVVRVSTTFLQIMEEYYPFKSRLQKRLGHMEIAMLKKSNCLVTHTHHHAAEMERLYGINTGRFHIVPHGIPLPILSSIQTPNSDQIEILFVGRFEYRKGIDLLLAAIPLVLEKYEKVVFKLIGADNDNAYEKAFRVQHPVDITNKVMFCGSANQADTNRAYASCHIFVAPSRYESFGLIYIEAMSYGKPVIGLKAGGAPDIIKDNHNGLLAEPENVSSLVHQLSALIEDADLRKELGANARKTVEDKFSDVQLASNSIAWYQEAVNKFA